MQYLASVCKHNDTRDIAFRTSKLVGAEVGPMQGSTCLVILPRCKLLHERAGGDRQVVDLACLQLLEVLRQKVGRAVVGGELAGQAGQVEVVVSSKMTVPGNPVESACNVLGNAEAVLVDQPVLLARNASSKPAQ